MSNNGAIVFISQLAPSRQLNSVYFPSWIIVYVRTCNICMNGATCAIILGMASWLSKAPIIDNDGIFLRLPSLFQRTYTYIHRIVQCLNASFLLIGNDVHTKHVYMYAFKWSANYEL